MKGGASAHALVQHNFAVPEDVLMANCPGADQPGMPLESLISVDVAHGADKVEPSFDMCCVNTDFIIIKNKNPKLPFAMGQVLDIDVNDESAIVQWWHPSYGKEASLRQGRKKVILDLFGEWKPADTMTLHDLEVLPPSIVKSDKILLWGFQLDEGQLPFEVIDQIVDQLQIDVTGVLLSSTTRGNLYRAHRLMR